MSFVDKWELSIPQRPINNTILSPVCAIRSLKKKESLKLWWFLSVAKGGEEVVGGGGSACVCVCVCVLMCLRSNEDINYLHVFPERAGVCVWLVAHFADVWLVWCVHMHVLFPVAAVGEASVAAVKFTLKRLLTCGRKRTPWIAPKWLAQTRKTRLPDNPGAEAPKQQRFSGVTPFGGGCSSTTTTTTRRCVRLYLFRRPALLVQLYWPARCVCAFIVNTESTGHRAVADQQRELRTQPEWMFLGH